MCGNRLSLISAVAFQRLPNDALSAPHASMPFDALHQPAYTSAEWSVNDAPVRGSAPEMIVGMPVLYVCGTARSGSTCCIATAMTSPTSAPGWCVPALTGLPVGGLGTQPPGTTSLIWSKKPSFFGISGSIIEAIWPTVYPRVLPNVDHAWISGRESEPV